MFLAPVDPHLVMAVAVPPDAQFNRKTRVVPGIMVPLSVDRYFMAPAGFIKSTKQ